jgi:hypothetical protein
LAASILCLQASQALLSWREERMKETFVKKNVFKEEMNQRGKEIAPRHI